MSEFEQKVLSYLEEINKKLNKMWNLGSWGNASTSGETSSPASASSPASTSPPASTSSPVSTSSPTSTGLKPSTVLEKQEMEEKSVVKPPTEGRRVCPKCSGITFNTVEDKTQILHQMGGVKIYAKKNICKNCGTEL